MNYFNLKKIQGYLVALSPIHHGGDEKTGAETLFNHQRIYLASENKTIEAPYISGNAIRGVWRRIIMSDMLQQLNYKCSTRLYHSLFSGGILESTTEEDSAVLNLELKKKVLILIKPLELFGTSYSNQTFEGKLQVGQLIPICKEYKAYLPNDLPEEFKERMKRSYFTFLDIQFQTRRDDLREERKEGEQAIQMLIRHQVLIAGTAFYHDVRLVDGDPLLESVLARTIELWSENPVVGGKASIGLGKLKVDYSLKATSQLYLEYLEENKDAIVEFLNSLK